MEKKPFFYSWIIACLTVILVVFTACDTEMTDEEILSSDMERVEHTILSDDAEKAGTEMSTKVYAYIEKDGEVAAYNTRILESSGDPKVDEMVLKSLDHQNFQKVIETTANGKEVIFVVKSKFYEPHPDLKFVEFDEAPSPVGGFQAIQQKVKYPEVAQRTGIEGKILIQGFINKEGDMEKFQIIRDVENSGLADAAINALKKTEFIPAQKDGENVGVWITIPVVFKLQN